MRFVVVTDEAPARGEQQTIIAPNYRVQLSTQNAVIWHVVNEHGTVQHSIEAFEQFGLQRSIKQEAQDKVVQKLREYWDATPRARRALCFAGFCVDSLYLGRDLGGVSADERHGWLARAALISRALIAFWHQRREDDADAGIALPMLYRSYAECLHHLTRELRQPDQTWSGEEREALHRWRQVSTDPQRAWFFRDYLAPWYSLDNWQELREREVNEGVWSPSYLLKGRWADWRGRLEAWAAGWWPGYWTRTTRARAATGLRDPLALQNPRARNELEELADAWYLPRFDLDTAKRLRWKVAVARGDWGTVVTLPFLGVTRLWAGILVGYVASALQSDTWALTARLSEWPTLLLPLLLAAVTLQYIYSEIRSRTGVSRYASARRAFALWWRGQVFAIAVAVLLVRLLPLSTFNEVQLPAMPQLLFVVVGYAQFAAFIGVFTQLVFGERPFTAPRDLS